MHLPLPHELSGLAHMGLDVVDGEAALPKSGAPKGFRPEDFPLFPHEHDFPEHVLQVDTASAPNMYACGVRDLSEN